MADTTFVHGTVIQPDWLNDVNDFVYNGGGGGGGVSAGNVTFDPTTTYAEGSVGAVLGNYFDIFASLSTEEKQSVVARDYSKNVRTKIKDGFTAAVAAGHKTVLLRAGSYDVGDLGDGQIAVDLRTYGDGLTILTEGDVEITCNTIGTINSIPHIFYLQGNSNFSCGDIRFKDRGYNPSPVGGTWFGANGFYISSNETSTSNFNFGVIRTYHMVNSIQVQRSFAIQTGRVRHITFKKIIAESCYYGFGCSNDGDCVSGVIEAYDCVRPYIVFGCQQHDVTVQNRNPRASNGQCVIGRGAVSADISTDTTNIFLKYSCIDNSASVNHVQIGQITTLCGTISNIHISLNIPSSDTQCPVYFANYFGIGGGATSSVTTGLVTTNIYISGTAGGGIDSIANYETKPYVVINGLHWQDGFASRVNLCEEIAWTSSWTAASGSGPDVGTGGSLVAYRTNSGGLMHVNLKLTLGTSPTLGTGAWTFTLPYTSRSTLLTFGHAYMTHSGSAAYGVAAISPGTNQLTVLIPSTGANVGSATPWAWGSGDVLSVTITYPI